MWYEGTSHQYTTHGTKVKGICKGQGQISWSCFSKDGCFGGISVSQTHLVFKYNRFLNICLPLLIFIYTGRRQAHVTALMDLCVCPFCELCVSPLCVLCVGPLCVCICSKSLLKKLLITYNFSFFCSVF